MEAHLESDPILKRLREEDGSATAIELDTLRFLPPTDLYHMAYIYSLYFREGLPTITRMMREQYALRSEIDLLYALLRSIIQKMGGITEEIQDGLQTIKDQHDVRQLLEEEG